jgi:hypothetical protein
MKDFLQRQVFDAMHHVGRLHHFDEQFEVIDTPPDRDALLVRVNDAGERLPRRLPAVASARKSTSRVNTMYPSLVARSSRSESDRRSAPSS